jgi:hypothetical protein
MYFTDMGLLPIAFGHLGLNRDSRLGGVLLALAWQALFRCRCQPQVRKRESRLADAASGEQPVQDRPALRSPGRRQTTHVPVLLDVARRRIAAGPARDRVAGHLRARYGVAVSGLAELDLGVYRVDRTDRPAWVARVFPPVRAEPAAAGDAEILVFLERHGGPAGWCLADGGPADEIRAVLALLAECADAATTGQRHYATLARELADADGGSGLPTALIHPDFVLANVIASPERGMVLVDWIEQRVALTRERSGRDSRDTQDPAAPASPGERSPSSARFPQW